MNLSDKFIEGFISTCGVCTALLLFTPFFYKSTLFCKYVLENKKCTCVKKIKADTKIDSNDKLNLNECLKYKNFHQFNY